MLVLLVILAVPLIEIGLFVVVGGAIGLWPTLAWVVATAALGVILLKGMAMIGVSSLSRDMAEFSDTRSPMAHRILVLLAAVCLSLQQCQALFCCQVSHRSSCLLVSSGCCTCCCCCCCCCFPSAAGIISTRSTLLWLFAVR